MRTSLNWKSLASKGSIFPSDLIKEYLSSSKDKKLSLAPQETEDSNLLLEILTVNIFLIEREALSKLTSAILILGSTV